VEANDIFNINTVVKAMPPHDLASRIEYSEKYLDQTHEYR
jgi:hypothetical protein